MDLAFFCGAFGWIWMNILQWQIWNDYLYAFLYSWEIFSFSFYRAIAFTNPKFYLFIKHRKTFPSSLPWYCSFPCTSPPVWEKYLCCLFTAFIKCSVRMALLAQMETWLCGRAVVWEGTLASHSKSHCSCLVFCCCSCTGWSAGIPPNALIHVRLGWVMWPRLMFVLASPDFLDASILPSLEFYPKKGKVFIFDFSTLLLSSN